MSAEPESKYTGRGARWYWAEGWPGSADHPFAGKLWSVYQKRMLRPCTWTDPFTNVKPTSSTRDESDPSTRSPFATTFEPTTVPGGLWSITTPPRDCATSTSQPLNRPSVAGCGASTTPAE